MLFPLYGDMPACIRKAVFSQILLGKVPHTAVEDGGGIKAIFNRGNFTLFAPMLQKAFLARLQKNGRTHGADGAGVPATKAIDALAIGKVIVDPAARLQQKAVVRRREQGKVSGRSSRADEAEERNPGTFLFRN